MGKEFIKKNLPASLLGINHSANQGCIGLFVFKVSLPGTTSSPRVTMEIFVEQVELFESWVQGITVLTTCNSEELGLMLASTILAGYDKGINASFYHFI